MPSASPTPEDFAVPERVELSLTQLAERARGLIRTDKRVILGIAGAPGAGKSTVAEALRRALPDTAAVVAMDGFHLAQDELVRLGRQDRKGAPDTFDPGGYAALLGRLREQRDPFVYAPLFRRDLEDPIANHLRVDRSLPLIVAEGNYLLLDTDGWAAVRASLDQVWFLDPPGEVRLDRLIRRHQAFGKDPDSARRWALGSDQANADLVQASRGRADLIVTVVDEARGAAG